MHNVKNNNNNLIKLDDLVSDPRLMRLFQIESGACAIQLWILQITRNNLTESKLVYGRIIPYSFNNNTWFFSNNDKFKTIKDSKIKITKLNLYIKREICTKFLQKICDGLSLKQISEELGLSTQGKFISKFGDFNLQHQCLVYKPVSCLWNKDACKHASKTSPHNKAGAFCASIVQINKSDLFLIDETYDAELTTFIVSQLKNDTGLDFAAGYERLGNIELLVFPTLDNFERNLLNIKFEKTSNLLTIQLNSSQLPHFTEFQFRVNIENNSGLVYSAIAEAEKLESELFVYTFEFEQKIGEISDFLEIEVFGFKNNATNLGELCSRWACGFIREIGLNINSLNSSNTAHVKFDWLEKTTNPNQLQRVHSALTKNDSLRNSHSLIGGRDSDPWVKINHNLGSLFKQLHPSKSEAKFFLRWGPSNGEGRLQFVEWFQSLLNKYEQNQIVFFDPYFDLAGIGLLSLYASDKGRYLVFTSLPKETQEKESPEDNIDLKKKIRIDNLIIACKHNHMLLKQKDIKIIGLKREPLHDRYILIMGENGLPLAGFNLSNSLQTVAENYPLLITPIPADTLLEVENYQVGLLKKLNVLNEDPEQATKEIDVIFDSSKIEDKKSQKYYFKPLEFLDNDFAGRALSIWTQEPSLNPLKGEALKEKMSNFGLLKDGFLNIKNHNGLSKWALNDHSFEEFKYMWCIFGELLANSPDENPYFARSIKVNSFFSNLNQYICESFKRKIDTTDSDISVIDRNVLIMPLDKLLQSSQQPYHMARFVKYTLLTWAEYYAVKLLWEYDPKSLITLIETEIPKLPVNTNLDNIVQVSILCQIVSCIAMSVELNTTEAQLEELLMSGNGLIQWLGLCALETKFQHNKDIKFLIQKLYLFQNSKKIQFWGWMINRLPEKKADNTIYKDLILALHSTLPQILSQLDLRNMIDAMRGHMRELGYTEPWLFSDILAPLLDAKRVKVEYASQIWIDELISIFDKKKEKKNIFFTRPYYGNMTNICAFLLANSCIEHRRESLNKLRNILLKQKRIVQQPLASTSNWDEWHEALFVSLWMLAFAKWCLYYLQEIDNKIDRFIQETEEIAMLMNTNEWNSCGGKELILFLEQANKLNDEK